MGWTLTDLWLAAIVINVKVDFLVCTKLSEPLHLYAGLVHKHLLIGASIPQKPVSTFAIEPNAFS